MRLLPTILVMQLCAAVAPAGLQPFPSSEAGHLKPADDSLRDLIARGGARSVTLRAVIDALERSDLIVLVRTGRCDGNVRACLRFLVSSPYGRYVLVTMGFFPCSEAERAGLLAHELQHALEIAGAADVVDGRTFERFYEKTGRRGFAGYETAAAALVARAVEREFSAAH